MKKEEAETLATGFRKLLEGMIEQSERKGEIPPGKRPIVLEKKEDIPLKGADVGRPTITSEQMERMYQEFKKRFIDELPQDPILVHLVMTRPEMILELEPKEITIDGSTLKGRVAKLIAQGFADGAKRTGEFRSELARTGGDPNSGQLSTTLGEFVVTGFLTREGDRYKRAPNLKITEKTLEAR